VAFDCEENIATGPAPVKAVGDGIEGVASGPKAGVGVVGPGGDTDAQIHAGVVADGHVVEGDVMAGRICRVEEAVLAGELHAGAVGADEFELGDEAGNSRDGEGLAGG